MSIRVLALTRYDSSGPSSRVRFYQFVDVLSAEGVEVEIHPLLDSLYVRRLLSGQSRSAGNLFRCYTQRLVSLLRGVKADVVWLEKELFPWAPAFMDPGLLGDTPYVVDYDDAVFHNYDEHRLAALRSLFGNKIPAVMRRASVVIAGNQYLADFAGRAGARRIEIIPSVVDGTVYVPDWNRKQTKFTIGWVGSPSTQKFLDPIWETLAAVIDPHMDRFLTIGGRYAKPVFPGHEPLEWSGNTEAGLLASLDVGIMPLKDAPFERGKCGFKLIQYMACGASMVASPVGVNRTLVKPGITGFLADDNQQWISALRTLKSDPALRQRMGMAARREFEQRYSLQVNAPKIASILRSVVDVRSTG
jgi:glycosyltransferase involved in cell wall biosynthesis